MNDLAEVLKVAAENPERAVFISRTGVDNQRELAVWIGAQLKAGGYIPILQDAHFKHSDFMLAMDGALKSGARVLALVSREYLASQHCMKEATAALDDQMNSSGRLVLLNIDDCEPMGVLRYVDRVRFLPVWQSGDGTEMLRVILTALESPADLGADYLVPAAVGRAQTIHSQILMHDEAAFAGRDTELARLKDLLWAGGNAALTRAGAKGLIDEAALAGMGGVGKTTLARAYAARHRGDYHGVWWVRAETAETLVDDLIALGARDMPGLERWEDREAAARETLRLIATRATDKPWLIVYDNAPGEGAVKPWRPEANAHVIVTSRNPNWTAAVELDVFTPEAAVDFLCETAGRGQPSDREDAAALADQLGYLPLALAHAGSHCQIRLNPRITFAAYSRRLAEFWDAKPDAADSVHGRYAHSVLATFSLALDDIVAGRPDGDPAPCPEAEAVMGVLAHLAPEQVPEFMLRPLFAGAHAVMPEAAFDRALKALAAGALVTWGAFEDGAPHLSVHRLVQEIMRARLAAAGRAAACAELAVTSINRTFDASGVMAGIATNARWLPHAQGVLAHAPREGGAAYHTLWTQLKIGDLEVARGSLAAALAAYEDARGLAESLAKADPANAGWQRDLSVSHAKIGDVLRAQGNLTEALAAFKASLDIRERLAKADPNNAGWQRDLSVSHNKIGDVLRAQGNLTEALAAFKASLAIAERLAKADPANAGWQRDLAQSHCWVGMVQQAQGKLDEALNSYRKYRDGMEYLAKADPNNAVWQRDLSVSHNKIGDVLSDQGNLTEALDAFKASLDIRERLAKADPNNAGWHRDLAISNERIGDIHARNDEPSDAIAAFERALGAYNDLLARNHDDLPSRVNSVVPLWRLGGLKGADGRAELEAALTILKPLAAADRLDALRRGWIKTIEAQIAALEGGTSGGAPESSAGKKPPKRGWLSRLFGG